MAMKSMLLVLCLLVLTSSLYTTSYWKKKAAKANKTETVKKPEVSITIDTVCN